MAALSGVLVSVLFYELRSPEANDQARKTQRVTIVENLLPVEERSDHSETTLEIDDPRISFRQLNRIGEKMAMQAPIAAIEAGMKIPGTDNREAFLGSVFRTWGETNGIAAASWASENLRGDFRSDALYYISDGWAESDPEGAGKWFQENTEGVTLDDATWEILESWGRKDPEAAFLWSNDLEPYVKEYAMDGLAEGWAAIDPPGALKAGLMMLEENRPYAHEFMLSIATQWAGSSPLEAAEWGKSLLDEELRAGFITEVGETWALSDPRSAVSWLESVHDPGTIRFAQQGIAIGWSEHAPGEAMDWVVNLPEQGEFVRSIVDEILFSWVAADPRGTAQWLQEKSPGPQRDLVLDVFSDSVFSEDPEAALAWANQITDPSLRIERVRGLLKKWIQFDGAVALEQIEGMDLPSDLLPVSP